MPKTRQTICQMGSEK